jgi:hypothetical protein
VKKKKEIEMTKGPSFILNGLVGTAFIIYDDKLERLIGRIKNESVRLAYQQSGFCSWEKRNPAPVDQVVILQCSLRQLAEIEYKKQLNI